MDDCDLLIKTMQKIGISSTLSHCLLSYLRGRGDILMRDIPGLPEEWIPFAHEQDSIGWDNFLLGMIGSSLRQLVRLHLLSVVSLYTADDWLRILIQNLLRITHRQWLYRNAVVHSLMQDGLDRDDQQTVFLEIVKQFELGSSGLHGDDVELINVDFDTLWAKDGLQKKYWLQAINSARRAKLVLDKLSS